MQIIIPYLSPMTPWRILPSIHAPLDIGLFAQHFRLHKRADIEPHPVIQVRVPAEGLLFEGFPAHKDVVGCFAFEDKFEFFFEV